jgi:uncharacterized membrane protein YfcA
MLGIEWVIVDMFLGSFVGFMAGLLGVGGGGILVPLLVSIFRYQGVSTNSAVHLALGTSLACMVISSTASIRAHASRGAIAWKMVRGMAPGIMVGAFLASRIAAHINPVCISIFFALFMALIAVQMFINWKPEVSARAARFHDLFIVGTGIGSISALAAVGGGFLAVTYLSYKNIEMKKAIGTSSAIGFPIAVAGALGYMISGWAKTSADPYKYRAFDFKKLDG